jgi:hypothetical protein
MMMIVALAVVQRVASVAEQLASVVGRLASVVELLVVPVVEQYR